MRCLVITCLLAALLSAGCAYRLGPVNGLAAGEKSIQIQPFINQTLEPRLTDAVTFQMHKELQRDGTFRLATHDDGDIVVSGVLTNYHRQALSFLRSDTLTGQDYRITLSARVTARDRGTGKTLLDNKPVAGTTVIRVESDLVSTERQALPLLAQDLAKNVTALLVEGSW